MSATKWFLESPWGHQRPVGLSHRVAVDSAGNLYIAEYAGRASAPDSSGHTVEFAVNQKGRPTRRLLETGRHRTAGSRLRPFFRHRRSLQESPIPPILAISDATWPRAVNRKCG